MSALEDVLDAMEEWADAREDLADERRRFKRTAYDGSADDGDGYDDGHMHDRRDREEDDYDLREAKRAVRNARDRLGEALLVLIDGRKASP